MDEVEGNCSHGDLRLGSRSDDISEVSSEGRLEVCINGGWGTICDNGFTRNDAQVACSQLGYDGTGNDELTFRYY